MTVVIKNKITGIKTECSNVDVIKVCKADTETYEVTEVKASTNKKAATNKKVTK